MSRLRPGFPSYTEASFRGRQLAALRATVPGRAGARPAAPRHGWGRYARPDGTRPAAPRHGQGHCPAGRAHGRRRPSMGRAMKPDRAGARPAALRHEVGPLYPGRRAHGQRHAGIGLGQQFPTGRAHGRRRPTRRKATTRPDGRTTDIAPVWIWSLRPAIRAHGR